APTILSVTPGNGQATVAFAAPASNGGLPITSYTVVSSPGGITASAVASPLTITGLTNGTAYVFTVYATNVAGNGPTSAPSSPAVTPTGPPSAPTITSVTAGDHQAAVAFTPPSSNGGLTITSYRVTSLPGGLTATGTASPILVTGLTDGVSYTFTVTA